MEIKSHFRNIRLKEPEFIQDDEFRTIIYRKSRKNAQATEQVTEQAAEQVDEYVKRVVLIIENEMSRAELMEKLQLSHRQNFIENYLDPAINNDYIEPIHAARTSPNQKYRLTKKGLI